MSTNAPRGSSKSFVTECNERGEQNNLIRRTLGPEALRCPELHDFSDLRDSSGRVNRPLMIALVVAAALTIGHFVRPGQDVTPTPVADTQTVQPNG